MKLYVPIVLLLGTATASPFSNRKSTSSTKVDIDIHIADVPIAAVAAAGLQAQAEHGAEQRLLSAKGNARDKNVLTLSLEPQKCAEAGEWCEDPLLSCCGDIYECRADDFGNNPKCVPYNEL